MRTTPLLRESEKSDSPADPATNAHDAGRRVGDAPTWLVVAVLVGRGIRVHLVGHIGARRARRRSITTRSSVSVAASGHLDDWDRVMSGGDLSGTWTSGADMRSFLALDGGSSLAEVPRERHLLRRPSTALLLGALWRSFRRTQPVPQRAGDQRGCESAHRPRAVFDARRGAPGTSARRDRGRGNKPAAFIARPRTASAFASAMSAPSPSRRSTSAGSAASSA